MSRGYTIERLFEQEATFAGLNVLPPKSIRIDRPVENSGGKKGKVVTTPDCFVVNPENEKGVHVELVNGRGGGEHKAAQKRVVEAAGIKNYVQVTGHEVIEVKEAETVEKKKALLLKMLHLLVCK